ncbi:unnamed protein product [Nesidiocoris tenuis]|uniref:Laminin EGF-like domain-containing protein n=1 Tax=Nesidiocoris tenuis TaxID=355587 RepID=A0A6H5GV30_9HEMI|nr:unnamed protein product [Nesidiocoris tenuis]
MDNNCDPASGQCKCFKNIGGRRCDTPDQGYYVKSLDLVYEAEDAKCTGVCMVDVHEFPKNRTPTWTGRGYMRVYDTSTLEFEIDDLPKSMNYQMIVRYDKNANVIRLDREVSSVKVTVVSANVRIKWLAGHVTNALKVPTDSTFLMAVSELGECNPTTGECPCKTNVEGRQCDQCKPGTKLIATGEGCKPCDCDLIGSRSTTCNEVEKTNEVIHSASEIRRTGTSGYGDKFDNLLKKIDDVNTTLINADENKKLLDVLNKEVDNLKPDSKT